MSQVGLDWYKREPVAYLGDVQGLTSKEHAVYSVVIELLYVHGGVIRNDPKFISGWISDMGSASVRRVLASLDDNPRITLTISEDEISQKRAKNQVKTKEKLRENAQESGRKGGEKSAKNRRQHNNNNDLGEADPSTEIQAERRREEKSKRDTTVSTKKRATRLPDDWVLPIGWGGWAVDEFSMREVDIRSQADRFKDYWIGVGGQKGTKLNWEATWRNWIRKHIEDRGTSHGKRTYRETASAQDTARVADENAIATRIAIARATGGNQA